jgi:hypothetical protein
MMPNRRPFLGECCPFYRRTADEWTSNRHYCEKSVDDDPAVGDRAALG